MPRGTKTATRARRVQVATLWRQGSSYSEIAKQLNTTVDVIAQDVRALRREQPDLPTRKPEPWNPADDAMLAEAVKAGLSAEQCAAHVGRPNAATRRRIGQLRSQGLLPPVNVPWKPTQDEQLTTSYATGAPIGEVAKVVDRPRHQVTTRVATLRRSGVDLPPRKPRWTDDDRGRLARLYREGTSLKQLEHEFGKTRGTITSQLRTLRRLGYDLNRD